MILVWMRVSSNDITVDAWVDVRDRRLLVVRPHDVSVWFLPGGLLEPGESLERAATREVYEETHITIKPDRLCHLIDVTAPAWAQQGAVILSCFTGGSVDLALPIPGQEIEEIGWITSVDRDECAPALQLVVDYLRRENMLD